MRLSANIQGKRTQARTVAVRLMATGALTATLLCGCTSADQTAEGTTSGAAFELPSQVLTASFDPSASQAVSGGYLDLASLAEGYASALADVSGQLKLQVTNGDMSYNYDLPAEGTAPIIVPMNMGDGAYTFRIMRNVSGSNYVELSSTTADVQLESPFAPFLRPNIYCPYTPQSACVAKAAELAAEAANEGDVVRSIYDWMTDTIRYDTEKAAQLADATGYVPNPDETLAAGSGICFDYASLAAAMFRSLGIPCKIVTGYVSPENVYHAWNLIYIDGEWISVEIKIEPDQWCRIDLTFAAGQGDTSTVGDGLTYTDRYVY